MVSASVQPTRRHGQAIGRLSICASLGPAPACDAGDEAYCPASPRRGTPRT